MRKMIFSLLLSLLFAAAVLRAQDPRAQILSPAPGSILPGSTVTFTWSAAPNGGDYFLRIGSMAFGTDIFNAVVRVTSVTLVNLPTTGGTIYLALFTQIRGVWQTPVEYTFTAAGTPPPPAHPVTLNAVTNAASYGTAAIAPGEAVTLLGAGMGPATLVSNQPDPSRHFPAVLAGARVLFNGTPAPLIYVSATQSAAVVPFAVAGLATAQVQVQYNGNTSAALAVPVTHTMPGVFSANASGSGLGAIQNADLTMNGPANPAAPGSVIVLYAAGLGQLTPAAPDGSIVVLPLPALAFPATVTIGGQPASTVYAGPAPLAIAGLYQINCVVPAGLAAGEAAVVITADGRQSQPNLTVAIQ
jgi:uncharacterized protein (TIGR03437 family)